MNAEDVAALLSREGSGLTPEEFDEVTETDDTQQHRTRLLSPVLSACQQLWEDGSEDLDLIAEKLGDGSRDVAWRGPYGASGILEFFLGVIAVEQLRPKLQVHTLRIIGNSCADTDENRARVVEGNHLIYIVRRLRDESALPFAVPVLYNILVDYEPAQLHASENRLNQYLIDVLTLPNIVEYGPLVSYMAKTLGLLITQEGEAKRANPLTVQVLLNSATNTPLGEAAGDFAVIVTVAAAYLADETFQAAMLESGQLPLLLSTIYRAHVEFELEKLDDTDDADSLKAARSGLQAALADITARDEYPGLHPLGSAVPETLLSWLKANNTPLISAACFALGNLSRSDETSTALVELHQSHRPLLKIVSDPSTSDPQVLHSALSFLKNLAIPSQNKPKLGGLLEPSCVPRIFSLDTMPQVQFAAVSLTRLLLVNCPDNVARVCKRTSIKSEDSQNETVTSDLCSLFERTDAEPTRMEASRAVATICRVLQSDSPESILVDWAPEDAEDADQDQGGLRRKLFYSKHNLTGPLTFLVSQQKWPSIRSEAWFIFALMCRSKEGTVVIAKVLSGDKAKPAIVEAVTGKSTGDDNGMKQIGEAAPEDGGAGQAVPDIGSLQLDPQQVDPKHMQSIAKVDRENAVVLCQELLRHLQNDLPPTEVVSFQRLIREGTETIVAQRNETS